MDPAPRYWDEGASGQTSRYGGLVAPPAVPTARVPPRADVDADPLDNMEQPDFDGMVRSFRGLPAGAECRCRAC